VGALEVFQEAFQMNNFTTELHAIEVASTNHDVNVTNKFQNINGKEFLSKMNEIIEGSKEGSHWIRTDLRVDDSGKCKGRGDENAASLARLLIIDADCRINCNGEEKVGAPDPWQVSKILKDHNIAHILHGSHSHYVGNKGNRYRIIFMTKSPYKKEQLFSTAEAIVLLINKALGELGSDLLAYAKENNAWSQSWYYHRKPLGCNIDTLYLTHMDGQLLEIVEPMSLPLTTPSTKKIKQLKVGEISPIHAFNEQHKLVDELIRYGYKCRVKTTEHERWLSPDSTSGKAGIIVKGDQFFSYHGDVFHDGKPHDSFDLMRVKEGLTEHDAIIKAAQCTLAPNGQTVDAHNKSLVNTNTQASAQISYNEYQPFNNDLLPVESMPYDALPTQLSEFIKEQSDLRGCPPDFVLIAILARMGVLFSGKVKIAMTRCTGWCASPNFFWVMVGNPSTGKSNALSATSKPMQTLEDAARDLYKKLFRTYQEEMDSLLRQLNSEKKGLDKENEKSPMKRSPEDIDAFKMKIKETQEKIYELEDGKPKLKHYTVGKITVEKLILILAENPDGILCEFDEISTIFTRFSKDEHSEERGLYLTGYNGNCTYSYKTVNRGDVIIDNLVLSILGGVQPSKLKRFVNDAKNGSLDDGFLQRFQGIVYPDVTLRFLEDKQGNRYLLAGIDFLFQNLNNIPSGTQTILRFDDEAQIIFDERRVELTTEAHDLEPHLAAHVGKSYEFVAALTIYLYLFESSGKLPDDNKITADYVLRAIKLGAYFLSHAKRMYGLAYKDNMPARSLASKLSQLKSSFNRSAIRDRG